MERLPKIIPVNELKNTANILKMCNETDGPIVITKNGYGEAVIMSLKAYEEMMEKKRIADLVNPALEEIRNGAPLMSYEDFIKELKDKYGI
ncbi:MAG: type II toxin-antitoxin system Phd/YefM family antitoxin [Bacilli bacterium]|nr:type II toxin-antitoxin system Phd/YefM family antitoxin [Bacilli bacterium]